MPNKEEQAKQAVQLLDKPNPNFPFRKYTVAEAAAKVGISRATVHRHKLLWDSVKAEKKAGGVAC